MDFDTVVEKRKSWRAFTDKKVSWKVLLDAVDAAVKGPWADQRCHCRFLIVEDPQRIQHIAKATAQSWVADATGIILVCSDDTLLEKMHGERGRIYGKQQAGAALITMHLKLTDLGIASCWIGSYDETMLRSQLTIPKTVEIEGLLAIGYPGKSPKVKPKPLKRALETVLRWESWDNSKRPAFFKEPKPRAGREGFGFEPGIN